MKEIVSKNFFPCFIYVFASILLQFVSLSTIYAVDQNVVVLLSRIHLWVTDQSWHTGPNDPYYTSNLFLYIGHIKLGS